jgi:DNA modification methylase
MRIPTEITTARKLEITSACPSTARDLLERSYEKLIVTNADLSRQLVSFQANKTTPFFRWFKYKEGFSRPIVDYILGQLAVRPGRLLDPFAGAGSALFAARTSGWEATGIELLPVGVYAVKARLAQERVKPESFKRAIGRVKNEFWTSLMKNSAAFQHVNITRGAFPKETEDQLHGYVSFCKDHFKDKDVRTLLEFAAFAILESISYTRKDGQYLRWDRRSGRSYASKDFDKGTILSFKDALLGQLNLMSNDMSDIPTDLFENKPVNTELPNITIFEDSCLTRLSDFEADQFDFILTSPPYCNRYDYTRTYALELVFLGAGEDRIRKLRQAMLSCTVENREKVDQLEAFYQSKQASSLFDSATTAFERQDALQEILRFLESERDNERLNNPGIVRMVRNYFLEMALVIHECARVMKSGGYFVMVNDNVSYNGEHVPVDLILSEFARAAGLEVEVIWKLSRGKGNSSQQMGRHGRRELRKCVYVWRKPTKKPASRLSLRSVRLT